MPHRFEGPLDGEPRESSRPEEVSENSEEDIAATQLGAAEQQRELLAAEDEGWPVDELVEETAEKEAEAAEEARAITEEGDASVEAAPERREANETARVDIIYFDRDDLLIDSGEAFYERHLQLWREQHPDEEEVPEEFSNKVRDSIGGKGEEIMELLWPDKTEDERTDLLARFRQLTREDDRPAKEIAGVAEGLQRLRDAGMRLGIMTNGTVKIDQSLHDVGIEPELFEHIFAKDGIHIPFEDKADALRHASEMTGIPLENIMVVGDATGDVQAGVRTGAQRIGIPRYGSSAEQLWEAGAHQVFANFTEYVDWVLNLPQFRQTES